MSVASEKRTRDIDESHRDSNYCISPSAWEQRRTKCVVFNRICHVCSSERPPDFLSEIMVWGYEQENLFDGKGAILA